MKRLFLIYISLIINVTLFGQGSLGNSDPDAKKVLDAVSAKFKSFKSVQAEFTLKNEDNQGHVFGTKKGTVFMKGAKYKVNINGQEIFCDGSNVWTLDKAASEVTITRLDPSSSTITPQKLFTNFYDKDFLYKLNGDKKVSNKILQEIEMTPVDKTKQFSKVYLLVDKLNKTIYSTRVLDKTGNIYTYTVNSLNSKSALTDALFVFDKKKYPGVEEIDLR